VGRPVSADEIRHTVAGYDQDTDEAFRRTFERDKDLLRQLGVPLRLEHTDAWEVEQGYVVSPQEYGLEDPGLTDDERAALWLAATMVRLGGQAAGPAAIFKLGGAPSLAGGEPLTADLGSEAELLGKLFEAVAERRRVRFYYRDKERRMAPYGLAHRRGRWYLAGETADGIRVFRIDRMSGLDVGGERAGFERPTSFKLRDVIPTAPWSAGDDETTVTVRFEPEVAWWARRQLGAGASVTEGADGAITARFAVAQVEALIGWLITFDDRAELLAPPDVRDRFVAHVRDR
jgi:predicted DNA-binding transcriptional regulator YafY